MMAAGMLAGREAASWRERVSRYSARQCTETVKRDLAVWAQSLINLKMFTATQPNGANKLCQLDGFGRHARNVEESVAGLGVEI